MADISYPQHGEINRKKFGWREYLGIGLIVLGLIISFWIFGNVYKIYKDPQQLLPFQQLVSHNIEVLFSQGDKETKVVLDSAIILYVIPILLLGVAVNIGGIFIKGGVDLVQRRVNK